MPTITDFRCRACTVFGGIEVASRDDAEALWAIPRVRLAVADGRMPEPTIGAHVILGECVDNPGDLAAYREEHAKGERPHPCPRVDLDTENVEAAELFFMSTSEEAARLLPLMTEPLLGGMTRDERARVVRRALRAMCDPRVGDARQVAHERAIEQARQRRKARG